MTVTATDADNDAASDSLTSTDTRTVTVTDDDDDPPVVTLGGDEIDKNFTWNVVDTGSGVGTVSVTVTKDGNSIFTSGLASGNFDFNSEGAGDFVITVNASDADNDAAGDASSSNGNTRTVTVV
jgi:hypothetical protein